MQQRGRRAWEVEDWLTQRRTAPHWLRWPVGRCLSSWQQVAFAADLSRPGRPRLGVAARGPSVDACSPALQSTQRMARNWPSSGSQYGFGFTMWGLRVRASDVADRWYLPLPGALLAASVSLAGSAPGSPAAGRVPLTVARVELLRAVLSAPRTVATCLPLTRLAGSRSVRPRSQRRPCQGSAVDT